MARRSDSSTRGKALDLWEPPAGAGAPLVCLATTFTFKAEFFELECLGRFVQMETDPRETENVGYLIEREEKLAGIKACVLVDRRHATEKESFRWDGLPVYVRDAAQHAKVAVLGWENHVRVIVGSGNLTDTAYRKNLEVFGSLDASRNQGGYTEEITEIVDFLDLVVDHCLGNEGRKGPKRKARDLLLECRRHMQSWPSIRRHGLRIVPAFGAPGKSVVEKLRELWTSASPPRYAHIFCPFFDPGEQRALPALLETLAKRRPREIFFYVPCASLPEGKTLVPLPRSLIKLAREHCDTSVIRVLAEQDGETRPLHAKMLVLENEQRESWLVGSSNFTGAGLGVPTGSPANLEANLVYSVTIDAPEYRYLNESWPETEVERIDLDSPDVLWMVRAAPDEEADSGTVPLPPAFEEAILETGVTPPCLVLSLKAPLPLEWSIQFDDRDLLTSRTCDTGQEFSIPWPSRPLPFLLRVIWKTAEVEHSAAWPVNVSDPASLPPPDALRDLNLEELLQVLGSTRPLYQALVDVVRKRKGRATSDVLLDPHQRINTEGFLMRRTKRVSLALDRLRDRLERSAVSMDALRWRMEGPVGPLALAKAFVRDARTPPERRFFLAELALALKRVRLEQMSGSFTVDEIRQVFQACLVKIEDMANSLTDGCVTPLDGYVAEAFQEAKR